MQSGIIYNTYSICYCNKNVNILNKCKNKKQKPIAKVIQMFVP